MQFKQIQLTDHEQKLHDNTIGIARVQTTSDAPLLVNVEEIDRTRLYEKFGETSTFTYCRDILKLTDSKSYALQAVARKIRAVPELLAAIQNGLSISTAHKLVAQITPENHAMWIEKAKTLKQYDLCLALRVANPQKRKATRKDPVDANNTRMSIDVSNHALSLLTRAMDILGKDEAAVLETALERLLDKIDPVRKADRAVAKQNYSRAESQVIVTARFSNHVPFNAQTFHEVNARDRGECQQILPDGRKCCSTKWPQIHHIIERSVGGSNDPSNLITLCSAHHRIHHRYQRPSFVWSPVVAYSA